LAATLLPVTLLAAFRSVNFVNVTTTAMKTRLALALLAAIVTAVHASGAANRWTPWGEQRSRQPYGPGPVLPGFHAPLPATPHPGRVPDVRPQPYGSPGGGFTPLPFTYQRPWPIERSRRSLGCRSMKEIPHAALP
jgi:hypothetical protein